jgi:hypothetical protein
MWTRRVATFHHDQHVQPTQGDGVDVEEIRREQSGRLRAEEGPPAGVDLPWRWRDPGTGEDAADGASADPVTEADQLTLHAAVAPAWVVPGEPQDEVADFVADAWTAGPVRIRPVPRDQAPAPDQQGGRGDDAVLPQRAGECPDQGRQHRPVRPGQPRPADLTA